MYGVYFEGGGGCCGVVVEVKAKTTRPCGLEFVCNLTFRW